MDSLRKTAVKGIVLNANGEVLLLKRSNNDSIDAGQWDLPGGRVNESESQQTALTREIKEETGLDVIIVSLHKQWSYTPPGKTEITGFTYLCKLPVDVSGNVTLSNEHNEYQWIQPSTIDNYPANESLREEIKGMTM